jgi:hypothetical protein
MNSSTPKLESALLAMLLVMPAVLMLIPVKSVIHLARPVTALMMTTVCLAGVELILPSALVTVQAHVNVMFSTEENPMSALRSAQIFTVKPANRLAIHTCVLNAKKDTILVKTTTVLHVLMPITVTISSRQRLSHVPVKLANTGTAPAAVVTVLTTALTVPLLDPNIVVLVSSDTSSQRIQTPV